MLCVPLRESYLNQIPKFFMANGFFSYTCKQHNQLHFIYISALLKHQYHNSDRTIIKSNRKVDQKCWDQIESSSWYWMYDMIMQSPELCNDSYRNCRCHFTGTGIRRFVWGGDTLYGLLAMGRRRGGSLVANDRRTSERSAACIHTNYRSSVHRS